MRVLCLLFQSGFLFFFFSSPIAIARAANTMLHNIGKSGYPCLLRWNAVCFAPVRIMFAVGLLYMAIYMWRYVPSMPILKRVFFCFVFNHKWVLNLLYCNIFLVFICLWFSFWWCRETHPSYLLVFVQFHFLHLDLQCGWNSFLHVCNDARSPLVLFLCLFFGYAVTSSPFILK